MSRLMKLSSLMAIVALLTITAVSFAQDGDEITLTGVNMGTHVAGPELDADDLAGKVVVFEYWGHQCPPCIASIPHINGLREEYDADKVAIIANQVWTRDVGEARKVWEDNNGSEDITVVNHGGVRGVQVRGVPHAFVFDHEGKMVWRGNPHPRAGGPEMDAAIEAAVEAIPDSEEN